MAATIIATLRGLTPYKATNLQPGAVCHNDFIQLVVGKIVVATFLNLLNGI
ncbi:hypothetical protein [Rhodanobacter sp. MP1X3]|uniref:hypothetical protein n=1 Tax=Rhodanobacter sp. MP1X3 TaxID=2723086 RepID=UPI00160C0A77|nr:hypothetical protein [Rhodanobacter sp. MP1X3]MBB6242504.1 hypothetical protein [Rhodanobacter sp. MP1X3]